MTGWVSTRLRGNRDASSSGISAGRVGASGLQIRGVAGEDGLLAVRACSSAAEHAAGAVAVGAAPLAEGAGLARRALVAGVLGRRLPTAQRCPEASRFRIQERGVAEAARPLAARRW